MADLVEYKCSRCHVRTVTAGTPTTVTPCIRPTGAHYFEVIAKKPVSGYSTSQGNRHLDNCPGVLLDPTHKFLVPCPDHSAPTPVPKLTRMYLCEVSRLIPHPNELYVFEIEAGCAGCAAEAAVGALP